MIKLELTTEEHQVLIGFLRGANVPAQIVDVFVSLRNKIIPESERRLANGNYSINEQHVEN